MSKDRSLKERLEIILKEYGYEKEPLLKIRSRFILHSALAYEFSIYKGKIFINIDFKGDLLLV